MIKKWKLTREGVGVNPHFCGQQGATTLFYKVVIDLDELILDHRGFMLEHEEINKIVTREIQESSSCENVANAACNAVYRRLLQDKGRLNVNQISVDVGLLGGQAYFTAIMKKP